MWFLALALLGAAIALAVFCPHVLTAGRWHLFHPRAALTAWFGSFGVGLATALLGIALVIVGVESIRHAIPHTPGVVASEVVWVVAGISGLALGFVVFLFGSLQSLHPESHSQVIAFARQEHVGFTLVWFQSEAPTAYAVPARRPEIFVSSAMKHLLTAPQLQAVLAHEFAHLRHRHGIAMRIAELSSLMLPGARAGRAFERATRLQIELAADDAAARQVGPAHLANALTVLADATQDVGMTLRAERLTRKRWPAPQRRRLPQGLRLASRVN